MGNFARENAWFFVKWGIFHQKMRDFLVKSVIFEDKMQCFFWVKWGIFQEKMRDFWLNVRPTMRKCVIFWLNIGFS